MKRFFSFLLLCLFLFVCALPCAAAPAALPDGIPDSGGAEVFDGAGLLSQTEIGDLSATLAQLSEKYAETIVIATVNGTGRRSDMEFADDFYDYNGYSEDGLLLLINMSPRGWYISTSGSCIDLFSDYEIQNIGAAIKPKLSAGSYCAACETFLDHVGDILAQAAYEQSSAYKIREIAELAAAMALPALAIALIVVRILAAMMKTVRGQTNAKAYEKGLNLTGQSDIFLYSRTTSQTISSDSGSGGGGGGGSSSHTSSSGSTHGGGGGSF